MENRMRNLTTVLIGLLFCLGKILLADPVDEKMHSIQGLLGHWDAVEKQYAPDGTVTERRGTLIESMGPGEHSHLIKYIVDSKPEIFAGHETLTVDPVKGTYAGYSVSESGPGALITEGEWNSGKLIFRGQITFNGQVLSIRKVLEDISDNSYTIRIYASISESPESLAVETMLKRKP
jgi:hypothetical protein